MRQGGRFTEIDPDKDVFLGGDLLRIKVRDLEAEFRQREDAPEFKGYVVTTMTLQSARARQIQTNCDACGTHCHHLGAALEYVLDSRSLLGLASVPDESVPLENLTEGELLVRAMAEREKRAAEEGMRVVSTDSTSPWADYVVTSHNTGKSYRVALRGNEPHQSYCSCPDFRTNGLGTCKHILNALTKAKQRFGATALSKPYRRKHVSLRLHYGSGQPGAAASPAMTSDFASIYHTARTRQWKRSSKEWLMRHRPMPRVLCNASRRSKTLVAVR
jgi:hypothetical protein